MIVTWSKEIDNTMDILTKENVYHYAKLQITGDDLINRMLHCAWQ